MLFEIYLVKFSFHFIITHTHHRFWAFVSGDCDIYELFWANGSQVLSLGSPRLLGLGFPVACWLIKPTNLRASDALALVSFFSPFVSLCGLRFSIFSLCFVASQQFPIVSYFIDINFHVSIFYVYLMCCQNDFGRDDH